MREEERGGSVLRRRCRSLRVQARDARPATRPETRSTRLSRRLDQRPTFTSFCCAVRKNEYNLLRERL